MYAYAALSALTLSYPWAHKGPATPSAVRHSTTYRQAQSVTLQLRALGCPPQGHMAHLCAHMAPPSSSAPDLGRPPTWAHGLHEGEVMVRGRAIGGRGMGVAHLCMCGEHVAQSLEAGADLEAQLLEGAAAPEGGERGERG